MPVFVVKYEFVFRIAMSANIDTSDGGSEGRRAAKDVARDASRGIVVGAPRLEKAEYTGPEPC